MDDGPAREPLGGRSRARRTLISAIVLTSVAIGAAGVVLVVDGRPTASTLSATSPPAVRATSSTASVPAPAPDGDPPAAAASPSPATPTSRPAHGPARGGSAPILPPSTTIPPSAPSTTAVGAWPEIADPCGRSSEPSARAVSRSPDGRMWVILDHGAVGTSDDRAQTWAWTCDALRVGGVTLAPIELSARTTSAAWAVARSGSAPSILVETSDAGRTWRPVATGLDDVTGVAAVDGMTAVAWGRDGDTPALRIRRGGDGWEDVAGAVPGPIARAVFRSSLDGWVVGTRTGSAAGYVLATTDGGDTWQDVTPEGAGPVFDAARGPDGFGCVLLPSRLLCTGDDGVSWTSKASIPFSGEASRVGIYDGNRVILAMPAGQVRWFGPEGVSGGQTITDTDGQVRAFAVVWDRYVIVNSDDGWIDFEASDTGFLEFRALGEPTGRARRG